MSMNINNAVEELKKMEKNIRVVAIYASEIYCFKRSEESAHESRCHRVEMALTLLKQAEKASHRSKK